MNKRRRTAAAAAAFLILTVVFPAVLLRSASASAEARPPYMDPSIPIDERVEDLLGRMTVEEKAAQLMSVWMTKPNDNSGVPEDQLPLGWEFSPEKAGEVIPNGIGHFARQREYRDARRSAEYANAVQKWLIGNTRLKIPAIFHDEVLHGNMGQGSTVFPVPIALASTWDTELVSRVFTVGARHTRIRGTHHVLGPNLDLARDPRWGRTEETYGEDPYLASRMAVAVVKALQGGATYDEPQIDDEHVIATGKHFAGHGQPEGGTNIGPVNLSERYLRETHFAPFEAAVKEADLFSMMPAYHEIDGIPVHSSEWMLTDLLRNEWGFRGVIVSDYYAMTQLESIHKVAADKAAASEMSMKAGLDIELPDPDVNANIPELVRSGRLPIEVVDRAVRNVLRSKFQVGLFEDPFVDPERAARLTDTAEDRALAAEAARKAIILLKNEGGVLPFDRTKLRSIAVIGPNAARAHLGGYTDPDPPRTVSILEGIKNKVGDAVKVNYAEGVKITKEGGDWFADTATLSDEETDGKLIAEAVETAKRSDAVVLVIGGNEDTNKEGWADNHLGDRDSLQLVGRQNELVKAVLAAGKPTAVFLINSGPLAIEYVAEAAPAILEGFYLGEETGTAAADVIFGEFNPGGKLPVTFPRNVGQLPAFYNRKPSAKRGYLWTTTEPLFHFGHGLSYTTFRYSNLRLKDKRIGVGQGTAVSVDVTNTGTREGDEVVQMYIRDDVSSVTRPVKELRGFERITIKPGESRTVTFEIGPAKLAFYGKDMKRVIEPGTFKIMVGENSAKLDETVLEVLGGK